MVDNESKISFFTCAEALNALSPTLMDEDACRAWILQRLHPNGRHCPKCGEILINTRNFWAGLKCCCKACNFQFRPLSGSLFEGTHFSYRDIFLMAVLIALGINAPRIANILDIGSDTARLWIKRFKVMEDLSGK